TGVFVCCLFAFEGAVLLSAEHRVSTAQGAQERADSLPYRSLVRVTHVLTIITGGFVLAAAWFDNIPWLTSMLRSPVALASLVVATLLIAVMPFAFSRGRPWILRLAMGAQATCILLGYGAGQYPILARLRSGDLTLHAAAAPDATLRTMLWALAIGLLFILPGTAYLIYVYK